MKKERLLLEAKKVQSYAYAPYSSFQVGAALLTEKGKIFAGCNIENASYSLTICAERNALFKAISEGERNFSALLVIGDSEEPISPCGACRQVIVEFCDESMPVYLTNLKGDLLETTVGKLLPGAFSKEDLAHARKQ